MTLWTRERNVTWAWRAAAVLLSMVAFMCFFAYTAQGMAIGDWIGLGDALPTSSSQLGEGAARSS
jgi:hypothetical protein